ncbi:YggT family protein [Oxalobacter sp. OttesenSCG-928-P03]|nr:YggT family protein [Oxalobacter sp. OttesenSCG-928-P03]
MVKDVLFFIIDVAAALFGGLMLLRFWIHAARVRPPMQIGNFIYILTNWLVNPLRRAIPGVGGQDWASLVGSILIAILTGVSKAMLIWPVFIPKMAIFLTLLTLFNWVVYGIMGLLILEVIFSWVNPHAPLAPLVNALNRPFLAPIRKLIPPIGGLDLSVMVVFILLGVAGRLVPQLISSLLK